jgi:hypothetical protein
VTALCLHPLDLACSKLVAAREKDVVFVAAMLAHRLIETRDLENQIGFLPNADQRKRAGQIFAVVRSKDPGERD